MPELNFDEPAVREEVLKISSEALRSVLADLKGKGKIAADSTKPSPFKSGAVLMAIRSGVPIIPMYIEKKKSAFGRLRIVIGESVDVRAMYGERPTFAQIDAATKLLFEREQSLSSQLSE